MHTSMHNAQSHTNWKDLYKYSQSIVLQFINLLQFCPATVGTQKHISELNVSGWAASLQMMVAMMISLASHNDHAHLQSPALKKNIHKCQIINISREIMKWEL